ncbi:MAG TPA: MotA/TolQ/ExbB proton channel family protein [Gemmataceae bacterium]|nr:MotA/TolQ/ExbB proton channel family protein [Gemmataceae bacterium]
MPVLAGRQRTAAGRFVALCLLAILLAALIGPSWHSAWAQDNGASDNGATPAQTAGTQDAAKPRNTNILVHILGSVSPLFGFVLIGMSVAMVAIVVILAMDLRLTNCIPPVFVEEFTDTVNKRRFKEAFELARNDNSFVGRVLTAGMSRLQYGLEDAREAALNATDSVKASKDQFVTYLATIGTLGPMVGLVGTVFGMIETFMVLGVGGPPNAAELAQGISHALVITLIGIAISVPAIFCHAFFRNRLIRVAMDSSNIADDLLTQMYHNSRKPAPAPEPRVATATAVPATPVASVKQTP